MILKAPYNRRQQLYRHYPVDSAADADVTSELKCVSLALQFFLNLINSSIFYLSTYNPACLVLVLWSGWTLADCTDVFSLQQTVQ